MMVKEKLHHKNADRPFYNLRVASHYYYAIGDWAFANDKNLSRTIEIALREFCDRRGIEVEARS